MAHVTADMNFLCAMISLLVTFCSGKAVHVWHLTDVHVDPFYIVGSDATKCYCETTASCSVTGTGCLMANTSVGQFPAGKYGNSEGNCATPALLYESGLDFMAQQAPEAPLLYFTGDFAEAGASYPCVPAEGQAGAEQQILDVISYDYKELRKRFKVGATLSLGCLGNHDSAPGDVFHTASDGQAWLYSNLSSLWSPDVRHRPAALSTLARGGYYSLPGAAKGLTVIALNINYWSVQNPALRNTSGAAYAEGQAQFKWLEDELEAAAARGEAVHMLGHQPPVTAGSTARGWLPGLYAQFSGLVARYSGTVKGMFFGHIHTDQWTLVRGCRNNTDRAYTETTQIKWCSGGGDWSPPAAGSAGGPFGAGLDGQCAVVPAGWAPVKGVQACEALCNTAEECLGFTWYPGARMGTECCFRTGSTATQPACGGPTCARCYEKPPPVSCDGPPHGVIIPGVSLTEGWPAMNPGVRLLEFDDATWELLDMKTYTGDLHTANKEGTPLSWELEYSFKERFGMADLSPQSFASLHHTFDTEQDSAGEGGRDEEDSLWQQYIGKGCGALYWKGYDSATSPFTPIDNCAPIEASSKKVWIATLNGTATAP